MFKWSLFSIFNTNCINYIKNTIIIIAVLFIPICVKIISVAFPKKNDAK
jgi:hypothetical protein